MSSEKYPVGQKLMWSGESEGIVVENFKLPGDICVKWDVMNEPCSYDEWFLDEHCAKIEIAKGIRLPKRSDLPAAERESQQATNKGSTDGK